MKRTTKNILIILFTSAYILLYVLCVLKKYLKYSEAVTAAALIIICFVSYLFYGYVKDKKTYIKKNVMQIVITQIIVYFVVTYCVGLIVGFLKNSYSLNFFSILNNIFSPFFIIISTEFIRYNYINANKDKKFGIAVLTILFIVLEVFMHTSKFYLTDVKFWFKLTTTFIIPTSLKHFVLTYLTYHAGYKPSLLYRIVLDGYLFVMPLTPDLGDYLTSMFGIILPFLIYLYASRFINEYDNGVERDFAASSTFRFSDLVFIIIFVVLAALISGYFPIYILGVGSASMEPNIKIGDAVIVEKIDNDKDLKINDVIVYKGSNKSIVHRLVKKEVDSKGNIIYYTKGDNNNSIDDIELTIDDISGKVLFRIPYIAYPSVFISDYFNKE